MAFVNLSLLCIVSLWFRIAYSVPIEDFFLFDGSTGDTPLAYEDDISVQLNLTQDFVFYNVSYRTVYVNTNGILTFGAIPEVDYTPLEFPLTTNVPVMAPFWADVDTQQTGEIYYRMTNNAQDVQKTKDIITNAFPAESNFTPDNVIIVTWEAVGYYFAGIDKVNTFQCALATDGTKTFAIYLYLDEGINWTTGDDADGEDGLGGLPAQVGFDAGDGVHFLSVEGSFTDDIINIETKSNVDIPGLFVFQINDEARPPIVEVTCPVVGTTACNERILQTACQYLNSTVATFSELPYPCQQKLIT